MIHYDDGDVTLHHGHALKVARTLPSKSVQTIVTSPPYYGMRHYEEPGQYGQENSLAAFVRGQVQLFRELRRVLRDDGTLWLNLGDTYSGRANAGRAYEGNRGMNRPKVMPPRKNTTSDAPFKNLLMVPSKVAIALQRDGWVLRNDIIWHKGNAKPESATDRLSQTYEHLFLLTKKPRYQFNLDAIRARRGSGAPRLVPTSTAWVSPDGIAPNPGDVWTINVEPFKGAHFAVFPTELARRCILAGSREGDVVLDPFSGSGTTGMVAQREGRKYVGIDLNAKYLDLSLRTRFRQPALTERTA